MKKIFGNKKILVTGGVGSIGSEIVNQLLKFDPEVVRIFDSYEYGMFSSHLKLNSLANVRFLVGDIRDRKRLDKAMEGIDFVFHAAALKHVEMCEYNPFEAVRTNIEGTQNILDSALKNGVDKVMTISSDKAVNPSSVMGVSKLVAEKLTVASYYHRGSARTKFGAVRFGNVIESNGSVIPTWIKQIQNGGPVTVTNKQMTRFMMSIEDAVSLVLKATQHVVSGEIFILKMPSLAIGDLADVLVRNFERKMGFSKKTIKIIETGKKLGEKLHEELVTEHEWDDLYENSEMYMITPGKAILGLGMSNVGVKGFKKVKGKIHGSKKQMLGKRQIKTLLVKAGVINED